MGFDYNKTQDYLVLMETLSNYTNTPNYTLNQLKGYNNTIYKSDLEDTYSKPMFLIGLYITVASLVCVIAMVADLLSGYRSKKLWVPCRWFTVNAFYLTVIAVAMKLPVDLSGSMPGVVDQVAKLGSMAFMCTMMANFLPSLATMDKNELLANITALVVLVVTLVVNVGIQLNTRVVSSVGTRPNDDILGEIRRGTYDPRDLKVVAGVSFAVIAILYIISLFFLLIIYVSSALAILSSKQIIESKYEQAHETASKDVQQSILSVEKLQQHVGNYWIMAGSGNPQFVVACLATTTASGVICAYTATLHILTMGWTIKHIDDKYESDYKWSTLVILMVQFVGVLFGTVAPLVRCFAPLTFKVSFKDILSRMNVYKVESYWTQKLSDWKHKQITFGFRSLSRKVALKSLKIRLLKYCIELQELVVVFCKMATLFPFFMICVSHCLQIVIRSPGDQENENSEQSPYVLLLEKDTELAKSTIKRLLKYLNLLIQKSEKKHPKNLMNLITEKSTKAFQGVNKFVNINNQDCWSLAVVTLTTIAVTLRKFKKVDVDSLTVSVREGLEYVALVEENLNASDDDAVIQKVAQRLWQEVDIEHEWLGIKLEDIYDQVNATASQDDTSLQIVKLFLKTAEYKISNERVGSTDSGIPNGDSEFTSICAKSMYYITKTILDDHSERNTKSLDELISSRIADIMAACLTNLPEVIAMKCHTSAIEKREENVKVAAILLGETKQIINYLQDHMQDVPSKNDRPFINKWGAYLSEP